METLADLLTRWDMAPEKRGGNGKLGEKTVELCEKQLLHKPGNTFAD